MISGNNKLNPYITCCILVQWLYPCGSDNMLQSFILRAIIVFFIASIDVMLRSILLKKEKCMSRHKRRKKNVCLDMDVLSTKCLSGNR